MDDARTQRFSFGHSAMANGIYHSESEPFSYLAHSYPTPLEEYGSYFEQRDYEHLLNSSPNVDQSPEKSFPPSLALAFTNETKIKDEHASYRQHAHDLGLGLEHASFASGQFGWADHRRYGSAESVHHHSDEYSPMFSPASPMSCISPASLTSPKSLPLLMASNSRHTPIYVSEQGEAIRTFHPVTPAILDRRQARRAPSTAHGPRGDLLASASSSGRAGSSRAMIKEGLECACVDCGIAIAQLNFRGKVEAMEVQVEAAYQCLDCVPVDVPVRVCRQDKPTCTYRDTMSGVVDELEGVEISLNGSQPTRLRRQRSGVASSTALVCDVCRMLVATGVLQTKDAEEAIQFGIETVCNHCSHLYSRCSDCGGGGGPRLGVGKWRCKELFPDGRRTCSLSHLRLGALDEMGFDCWRVSDLPPEELNELIRQCEEVHQAAGLTTLAVPDALEAEDSLVKSFVQVDKIVNDSWAMFEPLLRNDIEPTTGRRRYIGLRWSTPIPRKKVKLNRAAAAKREQSQSQSSSSSIIRQGKKIVGFVLAELDMAAGSLCLPCIMPTGSVGDTFDATTSLLRRIAAQARTDIDRENVRRRETSALQLPPLSEAWTMTMFLKDPRGNSHLEARRGFLPLDRYAASAAAAAATGGECDMRRFMFDRRESCIPPELAEGWNILARPLNDDDDDDWLAKPPCGADKKTSVKRRAAVSGLELKSRSVGSRKKTRS